MSELAIANLVKSFDGLQVINRLNMDCSAGLVTAVIGANGAGKSTLFNLINGFLLPEAGEIIYRGQNIAKKKAWRIAGLGIGRLFQDVRLFARMTVLDNILTAFPDQKGEHLWHSLMPFFSVWKQEREYKEKALEFLSQFGIAGEADKLAEDLSYGQQKLVAVTRLIASEAELLLLDEPTSGVDVNLKKRLLRLIRQMAEEMGKTIIIIEHNLAVVRDLADYVHIMRNGRIVESGETNLLFSSSDLRRAYFDFGF